MLDFIKIKKYKRFENLEIKNLKKINGNMVSLE